MCDPLEEAPLQARKPSSIERIQRLERLERERLEQKERTQERRRQIIAGARPSGGRHDLVDQIERVTKYPMCLVGIAWLVIVVVVVTTDVNSSASIPLVGTLFALWAILLVEYVVRLVVTPDRRGYLKRRWVEPATVVVPPLQGWHLVGIEKMSLLVHEGELRVEAILKHHSLFRVLIAAAARRARITRPSGGQEGMPRLGGRLRRGVMRLAPGRFRGWFPRGGCAAAGRPSFGMAPTGR